MRFTPSFLRSELSWPGKRRQHVTPAMTELTRLFRSLKVGLGTFKVLLQMWCSASLSMTMTSSAFSMSWCTDRVAL